MTHAPELRPALTKQEWIAGGVAAGPFELDYGTGVLRIRRRDGEPFSEWVTHDDRVIRGLMALANAALPEHLCLRSADIAALVNLLQGTADPDDVEQVDRLVSKLVALVPPTE